MMDSTLGRSVDGHHVTEVSTFSSPLDHVLRHVPKSHEKALRQAVYNVLAAAVLIIISFATYYAFQVQTYPLRYVIQYQQDTADEN